jgi:hypothetical protein
MFEEIISELAESGIELDRPAMAYLDYGTVHGIVSLVDPKNDKNSWTWNVTLADITERALLPVKDLKSANISFEEKEPDKDLDTLILTVAKAKDVEIEPEARDFVNRIIQGAAEGVVRKAAMTVQLDSLAVGATAGDTGTGGLLDVSYITPDDLEQACRQLFPQSEKWFLC